jgi:hypothetical protein
MVAASVPEPPRPPNASFTPASTSSACAPRTTANEPAHRGQCPPNDPRSREADVPEVHARGVFAAAARQPRSITPRSCGSRGGPVALCTATSHASRTIGAMSSVTCMCRRVERTRGASAVTHGGLPEGSGSTARTRTRRHRESSERQNVWRRYPGCVQPRDRRSTPSRATVRRGRIDYLRVAPSGCTLAVNERHRRAGYRAHVARAPWPPELLLSGKAHDGW